MRLAALLIILPALAWSAVWPARDNPMSGSFERGNQALSGAVERAAVTFGATCWTNYFTANLYADYFSQATKLRISKTILADCVRDGWWVKDDDGYTPTNSVRLTLSNVLVNAGAPAGWWTNHPYVNIAGDSNGWTYFPAVVSQLCAMAEEPWDYDYSEAYPGVLITNQYSRYWYGESTVSYADAIASATADYYYEYYWPGCGKELYASTDGVTNTIFIYEYIADRAWRPSFNQAITNRGAYVQGWFKASDWAYSTPMDHFDPLGDNVSQDWTPFVSWTRAMGERLGPLVILGGNDPASDAVDAPGSWGWMSIERDPLIDRSWHFMHRFSFTWFPRPP